MADLPTALEASRSIPRPRDDGPPGVRADGLVLSFGTQTVLDGISFEVAGGQFVVLLGPSGVGKSSLLRIIAGLSKADAGTVTGTDGRPISGRVAYMGQRDLLLPWLNVIQNVTLGARLRGEAVDRIWAEHLLERVGLSAQHGALPGALSGGMRQRAAIARTLYERQPFVVMDEPFSSLDAITRAKVQDLAAELLENRTVLLITHDPMEACRLGHHLMVLSGHPASLSSPITVPGRPPRAPDNPDVLISQAHLLRLFAEIAQ